MNGDDRPDGARPRGLRLSSLLRGILERHHERRRRAQRSAPQAAGTAAESGPSAALSREALRTASATPAQSGKPLLNDGPQFTVDTLLHRTRHAGFGLLIALLALLSLPGMGLSTPFGLGVAFGGLQMLIGWRTPWLPRFIGRIRLPVSALTWLNDRLPRWTSGLEKLVRPRFTLMIEGPFWSLCGLAIFLQGIGLALPLPIPGSNSFFIIPTVLYAIALLEDDGLLVMFCHALVSVQALLIFWAWDTIAHALYRLLTMISG